MVCGAAPGSESELGLVARLNSLRPPTTKQVREIAGQGLAIRADHCAPFVLSGLQLAGSERC
jgi:hypothetical protein